ncbi:MAG: PHB depolymerase family esterase [Myxococcota bacterium]
MVGWWMIASCGLFGSSQPVDAYIDRITVYSNDLRRTAFLHVPPSGPLPVDRPLWVVLHGSTYDDPARGRAAAARWIDALNADALFAFPEASASADDEQPWHGPWGSHQYRDLVFLRDLIDNITASHAVDTKRVYLVGHREGASLAAWAQCADPRRYAGFAFVDGDPPRVVREQCAPTIRRPLITLHQDPAALEDAWRPWLLETHLCTAQPIATPTAEGPAESRGQGRRHDCWTVPAVEHWTLGPTTDCVPRDAPPCDWVGPEVVSAYFDSLRTGGTP